MKIHLPFTSNDRTQGLEDKRAKQLYEQGLNNIRDIIAPSDLVINTNDIQLGKQFLRTLFVYTYPRFLSTNWLSPIINFDVTMDISCFIVPRNTQEVVSSMRRRLTQLESTRIVEQEKGLVRDPELETAINDIEELRDTLTQGKSRLFQFALYFTLYAPTREQLNVLSKQIESTLGGMLIYTKEAVLQMEQGFNSTLPILHDELSVLRNMDTGSLSTTFPFTSSELTSDDGILYGLNRHNDSLILFDRFNLENANSVVFAKSGAGKSYAVKLEILRYLMLGTDVIIIDPEDEYKRLCEAVGGSYLEINLSSQKRINPFDLPKSSHPEDQNEDVLRSQVTTLHGLIGLMTGRLSSEEDAILDKAFYETYALRDITTNPETQNNQPPTLSDLISVLKNIAGAENLIAKLSPYSEGTYSMLFNQPTNFALEGGLVVFSIRDLEEALRPVAMYTILGYIWNQIRLNLKRRIMVIDEAWWLMQHEQSARFLQGLAKRARKYYFGLTIISQDVEDFLNSRFGKPVVANSSIQLLMKQSPSSIEKLQEIFHLTEQEKYLLLNAEIGEGLFFAGLNHVAIKIIPSYTEDQIITSDPKQLLAMQGK